MLLGIAACEREADRAMPARTAPDAAVAIPAGAPRGVIVDLAAPTARPPSGARVYVFLRHPGERMPLAVQQVDASALPKRLSFLGYTPHENVELVARLSPSGRVERSEDDVEVVRMLGTLGHPPVDLSIDFDDARQSDAPGARPPSVTTEVAVRVRVSAEGVTAPADSVVYVVARKPGSRMPLAVRKLRFADLPAELALTDDDAMTYSSRLSTARAVSLFARLSRSGGAEPSEGDLASTSVAVRMDALPGHVALTIRPSH